MVVVGNTGRSDLSPRDVAVIREVYDNDNSEEMFLMELERAFQVGCRSIVIEPTDLAKETARWIKAGSFIKKVSVGSGVTALVVGLTFSDRPLLPLPFGLTSAFCFGLYFLSWKDDPCSQYRVETKENRRRQSLGPGMGSGGGNSSSGGTPPVVLVKKESEKSLWIVAGLVGTAFVYSLWRVD